MMYIVMNMLITILNDYMAMVKENEDYIPKDYEVVEHVLNVFKSLLPSARGKQQIQQG